MTKHPSTRPPSCGIKECPTKIIAKRSSGATKNTSGAAGCWVQWKNYVRMLPPLPPAGPNPLRRGTVLPHQKEQEKRGSQFLMMGLPQLHVALGLLVVVVAVVGKILRFAICECHLKCTCVVAPTCPASFASPVCVALHHPRRNPRWH